MPSRRRGRPTGRRDRPSRRQFLGTLPVAAVALAGCAAETTPGTDSPNGTDAPTPTPGGDPKSVESDHPAVRWRVDFPFAVQGLDARDGNVAVAAGDVEHARRGTGTPTASPDERDPAGGVGLLGDGAVDWYVETTPPATGEVVLRDGVYAVAGHSNGLSGVDQRLVKAAGGERVWESESVGKFLSVLAADDDRTYLATSDDALGMGGERLFAVGADGETAWSTESGDAFRGRLHEGRLVVAVGGRVYVAYDPATGDQTWETAVEPIRDASGRPAVADDLLLGQAAEEGEHGYPLVALDSTDGSRRWSYSLPSGINFVPTGVAATAEGVVGTEYDGLVYGLTSGGEERWTATVAGDTTDSPTAADGTVYVGSSEGTVTALDDATGEEDWQQRVGGTVFVAEPTDGVVIASGRLPRATDAGGKRSRFVVGLDPGDGSERWRFESGEGLTRPIVRGGVAYVGSEAGVVRALGE